MKRKRLDTEDRYFLNEIIDNLERITATTTGKPRNPWDGKMEKDHRIYNTSVKVRRILQFFVDPHQFLKAIARQDINYDITGVAWFTGVNNIGIVTIKNKVGEEKAYIGNYTGEREQDDIVSISMYGSRFPIKQAKELIKDMGSESILKYKYGKLV